MQTYQLCAFADEADSQLDGQMAALEANGIRYLELRGVDGKNVSELSLGEFREIGARLADRGLSVWSIGSPSGKIGVAEPFEAHLDQFKRMLEGAEILGARQYRLFSFYEAYDAADEAIRRLEAFEKAAEGSGVILCLENEKAVYGDTAERCRQLLDAVPALRFIFDPANFVQCGVETLSAWELLRDKVHYLHIKDALSDGRVVPVGHGEGHLREIVGDYLKRGGGVMTLEPHLFHFRGLAALERGQESVVGGDELAELSSREAFDFAAAALRTLIDEVGEEKK